MLLNQTPQEYTSTETDVELEMDLDDIFETETEHITEGGPTNEGWQLIVN